jgi:hypothetical protein
MARFQGCTAVPSAQCVRVREPAPVGRVVQHNLRNGRLNFETAVRWLQKPNHRLNAEAVKLPPVTVADFPPPLVSLAQGPWK